MKFLKLIMLSMILMFTVTSAYSVIEANNVQGYWEMTDLTDSTGITGSLTNIGATSGVAGIIQDAFDFEFSDGDHMDRVVTLNADHYSVNLWFKMEAFGATDLYLIGNFFSGLDRNRMFVTTGGAFDCSIGSGTVSSGQSITLDTWHMATLTMDGTLGGCYLDGVGSTAAVTNTGSGDQTDNLMISRFNGGGRFWDGEIDEISIWNQTLFDGADRTFLYNSGAPTVTQQYPFTELPTPEIQTNLTNGEFFDHSNISVSVNTTANVNMSFNINGGSFTEIGNNINMSTLFINFSIGENNVSFKSIDANGQNHNNLTIFIDNEDPIINNNIPATIFTYDFDGAFFSCTDDNLLFCNISIDGFNQASGVNFTLIHNGNVTYNITAEDLAGNQVVESGVVFVNPPQNFFFTFLNGSSITNFVFGGLNFTNFANISTYNSVISLGSNQLNFEKLGFATTPVNFTLNTTSTINLTTVITQSTIVLRIFDRETNDLLTGLTTITLQSTIGFNGSTITGLLNISDVAFLNEQYQILAEHVGYSAETVFFNYNNQELINIDIFMLNATSPDAGTLTLVVKNSLSQLVESTICSVLEWRPTQSAFVSVAQGLTNVNGETIVNIELNTKIYKFSCTKQTFTTVTNAQIIQLDESTLTIILNDILTIPDTLFPNLQSSLTNTSVNATHQLVTFTFTDSDGLTTQGCLQTFLVNGNRQNFDSETCVSSSAASILVIVNVNQTSDILMKAVLTTPSVSDYLIGSLSFKGTGDISFQLAKIGLDVLVPSIFILLGLGLGILLSSVEIAVILMGVGAWAAVAFVPTVMTGTIATFISVIGLLMLYGGYKRT